VLLGLNTRLLEGDNTHGRRYNTALLLEPNGRIDVMYHKKHRVPFGEYVPFVDWLPAMKQLTPYDFDYAIWPGPEFTRFSLPAEGTARPVTFGALICYEDTDPEIARPYGGSDGKPPADFLINLSNDGWFDGTPEHEEHLAICRFRAVEMRRSVARAVNMGVSALIDGNGRVLAPEPPSGPDNLLWRLPEQPRELSPREWARYKKVDGVLMGAIPLDERTSLYARLGDWLPWGCWLLVGGVLVSGWVRRTRGEP
jgi:apolipoprotein N-acyltransferase